MKAYERRPSSRPCQRAHSSADCRSDRSRISCGSWLVSYDRRSIITLPITARMPCCLGRAEACVQARLPDGPVGDHGGGAGARERAEGRGRDALGGLFVEVALQREDVALQPVQQVQAGADAGIRQLRQVGVQVDQAGQHDPRPQVDDCRPVSRAARGRARSPPVDPRRRPG